MKIISFIFSSFVSIIIIGSCVVGFWRGTWILLDIYIYPDDLEKSSWMCFGISIIIYLFSLTLGYYISTIKVENKNNLSFDIQSDPQEKEKTQLPWIFSSSFYPIFERAHTLFLGFASVCFWRSIWYFCDIYILSNSVEESCWITSAGGVLILSIFSSLRAIWAPPSCFMYDDSFEVLGIEGLWPKITIINTLGRHLEKYDI